MANTPNGLPYPEGTDRVMDGDDAIKALAQTLDPAITTFTPTPAAGWTVQSAKGISAGPFVWVLIKVTRTGADIGASASGNITDNLILPGGAVPPELRPITTSVGGIIQRPQIQTAFALLVTDGRVILTDGHPSVVYPGGGTAYTAQFMYMRGT